MENIYLVVEETGEYSQWNKENLLYFTTEAEAKQYAELQQKLNDIEQKESIFSVEKICLGKLLDNVDALIADAMKRSQLHETKIEEDHKRLLEQTIQFNKESATRIATDINTIIDEFEKKDDPFYNEKKQAILRRLHTLPTLIKQTDDIHTIARAREWLMHNQPERK